VKSKLLELIAPSVDVSDIITSSVADKEAKILSRSVAVATLKILADVDPTAAAAAIVDGGKDNGIDAIHYDPQTNLFF